MSNLIIIDQESVIYLYRQDQRENITFLNSIEQIAQSIAIRLAILLQTSLAIKTTVNLLPPLCLKIVPLSKHFYIDKSLLGAIS